MTAEDLKNIADYHKQYSIQSERAKVYVADGADGVTALDAKLQKKVEKAWWDTENCELGWTVKSGPAYYGEYGETVVIFSEGMTTALEEVEVEGVKITHGSGFTFYVYKDGEFLTDLKEAYEKGWLTKENIETIAGYHELYHAQ